MVRPVSTRELGTAALGIFGERLRHQIGGRPCPDSIMRRKIAFFSSQIDHQVEHCVQEFALLTSLALLIPIKGGKRSVDF